MNTHSSELPALPEWYYYPDDKEAKHLYAELQRELPVGHFLYGVAVQLFAADTENQDVLFQHCNELTRFGLVHLTWIGRIEINENYPTVEFDGTFAEFLEYEEFRFQFAQSLT